MLNTWIKKNKIYLIIFFSALFLRALLFSINFSATHYSVEDTIHADDGYYELSRSIVEGKGMAENPLRPPLWPAIIAFMIFTTGYWGVVVLELLMASAIPVIGMRIVRRLFGERFEKPVGWLMVLSPYPVLLSFLLYSETSFTFFFLLSLLFLFSFLDSRKTSLILWSSVFLGLATLIKPTAQFFPIIIPLALLFAFRKSITKKFIIQLLFYIFIFLLILSPWFYRNHKVFGVWGIGAQPAFNLYVYLVPTVLSIDNKTNFATELANFVTKDGFDVNKINLSNSARYKEKALAELREHKLALVKSVFITGITFFTHDGMLTFLQYSGITIPNIPKKPVIALFANPPEFVSLVIQYAKSPALVIMIMRLVWILITTLFLYGIYRALRKEGLKPGILIALLVVAYFAATTSINGLGVNARFRVPIEVFIFSFAIYGLFSLKKDTIALLEKK